MKDILINRGFTEKQASRLAEELSNIDERLKTALEKWLKDGTETDFLAADFSIIGLKQQYEMTYPAALLSIDWVLKDPDNAVKCIKKGLR